MNLEEFGEKAIPLVAEDIRRGRTALGITSARAAKRVGLSASRYRALEKGRSPMTKHAMNSMLSTAQRLGLKSVRLAYFPEIDNHVRLDLPQGKTFPWFIDSLEDSVSDLMELEYFVARACVIGLVNQLGIDELLDSTKRLDKQLIELWIAALYTISLTRDQDYFVRPVKDDPPDAEVLVVGREERSLSQIRVEITRFGPYSSSVVDVFGRKLQKKYEEGTELIVFIEQSATFYVSDVYEFVQTKNVHDQRLVFIGGAREAGKIKITPWELVSWSKPDENPLAEELVVDMMEASAGHLDYSGVIYSPKYTSRFPRAFPLFVQEIRLRC